MYKITVQALGQKTEVSGETLREAFEQLNIPNCKGKAILVVEGNGQKREKVLMPNQAFRLLSSQGLMKEVAIKNLLTLFGF